MRYRVAEQTDVDLLAEWNDQLIQDEGHRNPMSISALRERMSTWLMGEYKGVVFEGDGGLIAYALYREDVDEIYLRQLFVRRDRRRQGIGREAMAMLRTKIWTPGKRLTVEVLTANTVAVHFWRAMGYKDYSLTLEIRPERAGEV